jgi:hypothetical protein
MAHRLARFVALQRANEVPAQGRVLRLQFGDFGDAFLYVVFAEIGQAGVEERPQPRGGDGLLAPISLTSAGPRPARRQAAAMRARIESTLVSIRGGSGAGGDVGPVLGGHKPR